MSTITRATAFVMALSMLGGCASQATLNAVAVNQQAYVDIVRSCETTGDQAACAAIPGASVALAQSQAQAESEKQTSGAVVAAVVLLPLILLAAGAGGGGTYHGGYGHYHGGWGHGWHQ